MKTIVPRKWVNGIPRGFGNDNAAAWLRSIEHSLAEYRGLSLGHDRLVTRYAVTLEFFVNPKSPAYAPATEEFKAHGTDLDNLVKQTLDGLSQTKSKKLPPGLRIVTDDKAVYRLAATKEHVSEDEKMGVWVTVEMDGGRTQ